MRETTRLEEGERTKFFQSADFLLCYLGNASPSATVDLSSSSRFQSAIFFLSSPNQHYRKNIEPIAKIFISVG